MIIGYMLLDIGGSILISNMFEDVLGDKDSLFASAVSAISNLFGEAIGEDIHYIRTKNYHLYIGAVGNFVLILISSTQSERVYGLLQEALQVVQKSGYNADDITFSMEAQEEIDKALTTILRKPKMSTEILRNMARQVLAFIKNEDHTKYGIELLEPKGLGEIPEIKIKPLVGKVSLEELLDAMLKADYEFVIRNAPKKFLDDDLAKAIYAKAGIMLIESGNSRKVDIVYIYNVIENIENELIRNLLKVELQSYYQLGKFSERHRFIEEHIKEIYDILASGDNIKRKVLLVLLFPINMKELLDIMADELGDNELFSSVLTELQALSTILFGKPKNLDEWSKLYGDLKYKLSRSKSDNAKLRYHNAMQYATVWGLLTQEINLDVGRDLLVKSLELLESSLKELEKKKLFNTLRASLYYVMYSVELCLLLDSLSPTERINYAKKYIGRVLDAIKWLNSISKNHEIKMDIYYVAMSGLLTTYTKLSFILGSPRIFVDLAMRLLKEELEDIWNRQDYTYALFYIDMLRLIGQIASTIDVALARKRIILEVAKNLEKIAESTTHLPIVKALALINAIRFYTLSNDERAELLNEKILELGQFFYELGEIIRGVRQIKEERNERSLVIDRIISFVS